MEFEIKCSVCSQPSHSLLNYRCAHCSQLLNVHVRLDFEAKKIRKKEYSAWRYAKFFPFVKEKEIVTLGEGWTPLLQFSDNVHFKLENLNPTGSFKDRGSTVLISTLHNPVKKANGYISEDSSGNAGASIAAYVARAGLKAKIYVPENVSGPKFNQIQFYGAEVIKVAGNRSEVTQEAQRSEDRRFYVGHVFHPLFRDGIRSLAYEIAEQLAWHSSERVYLPVSAGTLLLGVISGFKHLAESNVIDKMPKIVACQTRQVSPLYHRFKGLSYIPPEQVTSIADALVSTNPPLLDLMVRSLKEAHGDAVMVDENEIFNAFMELSRLGFFVEPSSAVAYAAYMKQFKNQEIAKNEKVVIVLTGTGLKTTLKPKSEIPKH